VTAVASGPRPERRIRMAETRCQSGTKSASAVGQLERQVRLSYEVENLAVLPR